jgi:hypothetical protein
MLVTYSDISFNDVVTDVGKWYLLQYGKDCKCFVVVQELGAGLEQLKQDPKNLDLIIDQIILLLSMSYVIHRKKLSSRCVGAFLPSSGGTIFLDDVVYQCSLLSSGRGRVDWESTLNAYEKSIAGLGKNSFSLHLIACCLRYLFEWVYRVMAVTVAAVPYSQVLKLGMLYKLSLFLHSRLVERSK